MRYMTEKATIESEMADLSNYGYLKLKGNKGTVPILYKADPEAINHFFVLLRGYSVASSYNLKNLKYLKQKAVSLIEYFKTKSNFQ